jgi:hypothetical protein
VDVAPPETTAAPAADPKTLEAPPVPPLAAGEDLAGAPTPPAALAPEDTRVTAPPTVRENAVPVPETALPTLPETVGDLIGRAQTASGQSPPLDPDALPAAQAIHANLAGAASALGPRGSTWDPIARHLTEQALRDGAWGRLLRGLAALLGCVVGLRMVFDPALPRVLLALLVSAAVVALTAMGLQALALARRQRTLLLALRQLAVLARREALRDTVGPRLDAVLESLREEPRVWPRVPPRPRE